MIWAKRCVGVVIAGMGLLAIALAVAFGRQERDDPPMAVAPTEPIPSLRADANLARKLDAARDYVERKAWGEATHALQALLDHGPDALVAIKRPGQGSAEASFWTGLHAEAARLLGTLPPAGREFYELAYGPRARALLGEARQQGDLATVADVARRFAHTAAGSEAIGLLGAYHLDRGRPLLASICFARLLDRPAAPAPATLFCAALAFRRSGDAARAEQAWQRLAAIAPAGLRVADRLLSLEDLRKELERSAPPAPALVRGPAGADELEARWARPTFKETVTRGWLLTALRAHENNGGLALAEFHPLAIGDKALYRSYGGIHAVDLRTGQSAWEASSRWSVDAMTPVPRYASYLEEWVDTFMENSPQVLFSNAVLGTLSTDGARVYAVDDLAVPPVKSFVRSGRRWQEPPWPDFGPELTDAAYHNRLVARDVSSGQKRWEVGGRGTEDDADELNDTYFLGPPLPLDGRLYAIVEQHTKLSLVCLRAETGELLWRQTLAMATTGLLHDPGRHLQPACPAYADGVLVCPTNAGVIVGVDVLTRGLAWAYPYRTEALTQSPPVFGRGRRVVPPKVYSAWKPPATIVEKDRVLCTAPDEPSIHCLSLRDGSLLWKTARAEDDLYLAGIVAGRVLVVGRQACRALNPADGTEVWKLPTGQPAGLGVARGDVYYLPLRETVTGRAPAVYAIDARKGTIMARGATVSRDGIDAQVLGAGAIAGLLPPGPPHAEVPGNLFLWQGEVLSQTAAAVTIFGSKPAR